MPYSPVAQTKDEKKEKAKAKQEVKQAAQKATAKEAVKKKGFAEGREALSPKAKGAIQETKQPEIGDSKQPSTPVETAGPQPEPPPPILDPTVQPDYKSEHVPDPEVKPVKGRPFIKGEGDKDEIDINDVSQGRLGDCYFMAALAAIAHANPDVIRKRVKDNGDGTYTVTFFEGGDVVVDNQFAVSGGGSPVYADAGDRDGGDVEMWVMLIEKAWAKLKGGYENIRGSKVRMTSADAMQAVSGKETRTIRPQSLSDEELIKVMAEASQKKWAMTLGAFTKESVDESTRNEAQKLGIVFNHAYAVTGVDQAKGEISLYNPWGKEYKVPTLTAAQVKKFYSVLHINKVSE